MCVRNFFACESSNDVIPPCCSATCTACACLPQELASHVREIVRGILLYDYAWAVFNHKTSGGITATLADWSKSSQHKELSGALATAATTLQTRSGQIWSNPLCLWLNHKEQRYADQSAVVGALQARKLQVGDGFGNVTIDKLSDTGVVLADTTFMPISTLAIRCDACLRGLIVRVTCIHLHSLLGVSVHTD